MLEQLNDTLIALVWDASAVNDVDVVRALRFTKYRVPVVTHYKQGICSQGHITLQFFKNICKSLRVFFVRSVDCVH